MQQARSFTADDATGSHPLRISRRGGRIVVTVHSSLHEPREIALLTWTLHDLVDDQGNLEITVELSATAPPVAQQLFRSLSSQLDRAGGRLEVVSTQRLRAI